MSKNYKGQVAVRHRSGPTAKAKYIKGVLATSCPMH